MVFSFYSKIVSEYEVSSEYPSLSEYPWQMTSTLTSELAQKVSEYDQGISQSHTADQPTEPFV